MILEGVGVVGHGGKVNPWMLVVCIFMDIFHPVIVAPNELVLDHSVCQIEHSIKSE